MVIQLIREDFWLTVGNLNNLHPVQLSIFHYVQ